MQERYIIPKNRFRVKPTLKKPWFAHLSENARLWVSVSLLFTSHKPRAVYTKRNCPYRSSGAPYPLQLFFFHPVARTCSLTPGNPTWTAISSVAFSRRCVYERSWVYIQITRGNFFISLFSFSRQRLRFIRVDCLSLPDAHHEAYPRD